MKSGTNKLGWRLGLAAMLIVLACAPRILRAQETKPAEQKTEQEQQPGMQRELVHEANEAAGEEADENAKFKQSPAVKWIAKVTGLDLVKAYWLCVIFNFAVIGGVIVWALGKSLPGAFRSRTASIQKAMQEAQKSSEDAQRKLAEIESRLSKLDTEIAALQTNAEREAAAEEVRIKAAAEEDARKIIQAAEQEIAAAAKNARRDLTAHAADLAVGLAQKQIHVDAATDEALVRKFAGQLGAATGGPGSGSGKDGR